MTHQNLTVLLGPPGTGKTTSLLDIVQRELERGTRPERIGFLAFSKKAATEAMTRAGERFNLRPEALTFFRTIHSLTFRQLGLRPGSVMQYANYRDLGNRIGIDLGRSRGGLDDTDYGMSKGDRMLFLEGLSRVQGRELLDIFQVADEPGIDFRELEQLARALVTYKANNRLTDYSDMLEQFTAAMAPELDAVIVDEAQDLSRQQWRVIDMVAAKAKRLYVAGDDDQAVFRWAGADVDTFQGLGGVKRVLGQSYRCPALVHERAARIIGRVHKRVAKDWVPRQERGAEFWYQDAEEVDMSRGTWLLLARNGYMLQELEDLCMTRGFSFTSAGKSPLDGDSLKALLTWERMRKGIAAPKAEAVLMLKFMTGRHVGPVQREQVRKLPDRGTVLLATAAAPPWFEALDKIAPAERDYFRAVLRRGDTITKTPRIEISTFHRAKGGEADNVLLLTDMSQRTFTEMEREPDSEHRCWYVAVTRARQALHLIQPKTTFAYEF